MGDCVVYIETNFLMGVATGREPRGTELLNVASASTRFAIPSVCYMEAFSALEDEKGRRNRFKGQLEHQIAQLRRDLTSPHAKTLLALLEESSIRNDRLLNDVEDRLLQYIAAGAAVLEMIPLTPVVLAEAVNRLIIADPTDNLILTSILHHARQTPEVEKALLTANDSDFDTEDVRRALRGVSITKYFKTIENTLGWLGSRSGARENPNG